MLHDYWMYRPDESLVKAGLPGTRTVLDWFSGYERPDGLLGKLPWWSFVDWVSTGELSTYPRRAREPPGAARAERLVRKMLGCRPQASWPTILPTALLASSRMFSLFSSM
jgi:hypothetical protein